MWFQAIFPSAIHRISQDLCSLLPEHFLVTYIPQILCRARGVISGLLSIQFNSATTVTFLHLIVSGYLQSFSSYIRNYAFDQDAPPAWYGIEEKESELFSRFSCSMYKWFHLRKGGNKYTSVSYLAASLLFSIKEMGGGWPFLLSFHLAGLLLG
jgi:hypothetical protein